MASPSTGYGAIPRDGSQASRSRNNPDDDPDEIRPLLPEHVQDVAVENHPPPNSREAPDDNVHVEIDSPNAAGDLENRNSQDVEPTYRNAFARLYHGLFSLIVGDGEENISNTDTIFHMLKGNVGTGILAMPDAMKNAGLAVGSAGLIFMSVICIHCMHLLVRANHRLKALGRLPEGKDVLTYSDVMELTVKQKFPRCSTAARNLITIFLCLTQFGFCCVYFVFVSQNIKLVCDHHIGPHDYHLYMGIVLPFVLIICSVRNLKNLSILSVLANFLQLVALALMFIYLGHDLTPTWDRKMVADWSQLPLFFGTAIYAFEGIGVILPLENQMATPQDLPGWNGVLNTSMIIVTCLYFAVGFFGYVQYGEAVLGSVTLNLPVEETLAQTIIVMFAIAIFFTYAIQFYVPLEILVPIVQDKVRQYIEGRDGFVDLALRYFLILITFAFAALIPRLDIFISLVGALSSSTLALLAPPLIDSLLFWDEYKVGGGRRYLLKNAAIFVVGFAGFATGTALSLKKIIEYFETGK